MTCENQDPTATLDFFVNFPGGSLSSTGTVIVGVPTESVYFGALLGGYKTYEATEKLRTARLSDIFPEITQLGYDEELFTYTEKSQKLVDFGVAVQATGGVGVQGSATVLISGMKPGKITIEPGVNVGVKNFGVGAGIAVEGTIDDLLSLAPPPPPSEDNSVPDDKITELLNSARNSYGSGCSDGPGGPGSPGNPGNPGDPGNPGNPGNPLGSPYGAPGEYGDPSHYKDPLVLDLDGDGIELIAQSAATAYFDLDQDGFAERAGWVSGDDGMLVLDANGDGIVNDLSELVGSGFVSPFASTDRLNDGPTGFAELATIDDNGDGVIDAGDFAWAQLQVWRDLDGDGFTDAGELMGLDAAGVASIATQAIDLLPNPQSAVDSGGAGGNVITQEGSFTRTDGTTGIVGDVWLSYAPMDTRSAASVQFDMDAIFLPFLSGVGELKNSFFAISEDPLLKEMAQDIAATTLSNVHELATKVEAFILRWAGADDVNPQSRGQYTNGAYLAAVEKFTGTEFRQLGVSTTPYPFAGSVMMGNFKQFQSAVMRQILPQIPLGRELMPELSPGYVTSASLDAGSTLAPMLARMAANAPDATGATAGEAVAYWNGMALLVHALKDQLPETDTIIAEAFTATLDAQGLNLTYDQIRSAFIGGAGEARSENEMHNYRVKIITLTQSKNAWNYARQCVVRRRGNGMARAALTRALRPGNAAPPKALPQVLAELQKNVFKGERVRTMMKRPER